MEISEYKNIYQNESSHFYYQANHNLILSLIKSLRKKHLKILDAGCGTGLLAKKMQKFGEVYSVDKSPEAVKFTRKRGIKVIRSGLEALPFKDHSFDLVTCIDVLGHDWIPNDSSALKELYRVLKPGGYLIIRVSANPSLKTNHDEYVFTKHRYSRLELAKKLKKSGFLIERLSHINSALFPFAFIKGLVEKYNPKAPQSGIIKMPAILNNALISLLSIENFLFRIVDLPFGVGLIALCKKPT